MRVIALDSEDFWAGIDVLYLDLHPVYGSAMRGYLGPFFPLKLLDVKLRLKKKVEEPAL